MRHYEVNGYGDLMEVCKAKTIFTNGQIDVRDDLPISIFNTIKENLRTKEHKSSIAFIEEID